jgi:hypothetical protein
VNTYHYFRYIEQYQSLLSSSGSGAQRQDLDIYWGSVRAASGEISNLEEDSAPDAVNVAYVEGTSGSTEASLRLYYEKWLASPIKLVEGPG